MAARPTYSALACLFGSCCRLTTDQVRLAAKNFAVFCADLWRAVCNNNLLLVWREPIVINNPMSTLTAEMRKLSSSLPALAELLVSYISSCFDINVLQFEIVLFVKCFVTKNVTLNYGKVSTFLTSVDRLVIRLAMQWCNGSLIEWILTSQLYSIVFWYLWGIPCTCTHDLSLFSEKVTVQ